MPIWGTHLWGDGSIWGAPVTYQGPLLWAIEVDWDGDGVFNGVNEAAQAVGLHSERGRDYYIRVNSDDKAIGFGRVMTGSCIVTLKNVSDRYDPYNTASPLYPNVASGKFVRVRVLDTATLIIHDVFAGKIADIRPIAGEKNKVRMKIVDGMSSLKSGKTGVVLQENIAVADAISAVLDDASWPTVWGRSLATSAESIPYWWSDGESFATACHDLADVDLGTFFIAADGKATFYSRNTTPVMAATFDQAQLKKEILLSMPWDVLRDQSIVTAHPRVLRATGDLWTLQDKPYFAAGESREIWAAYTYATLTVPAKSVITPAATTDYTANTAIDGSGTNLTANFTVSASKFSQTAKLTVTNTGGTGGYLTLLKIRGDALDSPSSIGGRAGTGKRVFELDTKWLQSTTKSQDYATFLNSFLSGNLVFPTVQIEARPELQFPPDLFDAAAVTVAAKSISGNFKFGKITHDWLSENGQSVRTEFKLEPYPDISGYWQFDVLMGIGTQFAL